MNWFDIASHLFVALPLYMAYITNQTLLIYSILVTTIISLAYHSNENTISLHLDEFASCALIVVTFMIYINNVYRPTYVALGFLLIVVIVDYFADVDIINYYVGLVVFVAVLLFFYERQTLKETPQRLKIKDVYFVSFLFTQMIAIAFFLWDKDPYAHSLWHLFAFVSLGSAIAHIHENDQDLKRKVFYVLGSIPSRLFISAILIHWNTSSPSYNIPVAVGMVLLALVLLAKPVINMWRNRDYYLFLHGVSYIIIALFIFIDMSNNVAIAGVWLLVDTLISGYMWYKRDQVVETAPSPTFKKLQLHNLRF